MSALANNAIVGMSLRRPVAMMMLLVSMLVLGSVALARIPLELVPSGFSAPFLRVAVTYPDASAKDVEERITRPIEQAVATTPGVDRQSSRSVAGSSSVTLVFKGDVDMRVAYRQVRDRIARVRRELPSEVTRVEIRKESGESIPIAFYGVTWDESLADPTTLIDRQIVQAIERIEGVALVEQWGREEPSLRIDVDRALAEAAGVDMLSLVSTLARSNFTLASGEITEGESRYLLRSVAAWQSAEQVAALPIGPAGLRLRDIADVRDDRPPVTRFDRFRGRPSMVVSVIKESQANTVAVSDAIQAVMADAASRPELEGIAVEPIFVQGDTIRYSLGQVVDSGLQGGALALVVLGFFLRRLRMTLVIAASIPLSLFLALPVMDFSGQSINIVSLVGLMICIGLVVDNSVVVAENVHRYRQRGMGPYTAALHGTSEVALAITLATMTTIVVFLPAALLSEGVTQFLMVRMVTPVCVSLLASLFVALVLVPLCSATLLHAERGDGPNAVARATEWLYERTIGVLSRGYVRLLRGALRRRIDVVMGCLLMFASLVVPAMNVRCDTGRNFGARNVSVRYALPNDISLEEADAFFRSVERKLESVRDEFRIDGVYVGFDVDAGQVQVFFRPPTPDEPPFDELAQSLVDALPTPAGWVKRSQLGDSDGARDDSFPVAIYGEDHEEVARTRAAVEAQLLRLDGVRGLLEYGEPERSRDELALEVDRDAAQRHGIAGETIANLVAYAIRGTPLPRFAGDRRQVEVRVRYREDDRKTVDQLLGYEVPRSTGGAVPLQALAERTLRESQAQLTRTNKRVGALIRLELDPQRRTEVSARIREFLANYRLPEGQSFDAGIQSEEITKMQRDLTGAVVLGAIFVFLLMGFLFESVLLPLSVLPSIPLAFVGVWWSLHLSGESIDALAGIGIVLLLGVVVNNAIVLIDFVNQARRDGLSREDAILAAAVLRFRPILMTALTTVGGMIPLAYAPATGEGIPYGPFGKALVGGMTTATVLTLVVVPVTYSFLDDVRVATRHWLARLRQLGPRAPRRPDLDIADRSGDVRGTHSG